MNLILETLSKKNSTLSAAFKETYAEVKLLLNQYITNFPSYTDHSINHTEEVLNLASLLMTREEIDQLNDDELYILAMACILHDVGMCIPEEKIKEVCVGDEYENYLQNYSNRSVEVYLRDVHHVLSKNFIIREQNLLKIPSSNYAEAIALVAQGHRKVDLQDFEEYKPQFFAKSGRDFVCLPYLSCILRIADELDVTNMRTPDLLLKYYLPNNDVSIKEFSKHQSTMQVNFLRDTVLIESECTDHNILAALEEQFEKIQNVISSCQKVIRSISKIEDRNFSLQISKLEPKLKFKDFDPKGIKYSFDVKNVINAFVGKDLYGDHLASLREAIQNGIDACNFRHSLDKNYNRELIISVSNDEIKFSDNGNGMDEFIIESYFGRLASSYYQQENVKNTFQAIGQFGIGVFSYFLIADYIEVETKNQKDESLRFRTDQDPSGYFHFFDGYKKENKGTSLTLHLKDEYKGKINFSLIEKFIRKNFPFIDMDIILLDENREVKISPSKFEINLEKDVLRRVYHSQLSKKNNITILNFEYKDESVEGIMSLLLPSSQKAKTEFEYLFNNDTFQNKDHVRLSEIATSQKGVFVANYSMSFSQCLGKINILNKLKITLNREAFRDITELNTPFGVFEAGLIRAYFNNYLPSLNIKTAKAICEWSHYFVRWIVTDSWDLSDLARKELNKYVKFEVLINNSIHYLSAEEIKDKSVDLVFLTTEMKAPSVIKDHLIFRRQVSELNLALNTLGDYLKYGMEIFIVDEIPILLLTERSKEITKKHGRFLSEIEVYEGICVLNNNKIGINLESSGYIESIGEYYPTYYKFKLNCKSDFMNFIFENRSAIIQNSSNRLLIKEVLNKITELYSNNDFPKKAKGKNVAILNELLLKLELPQDVIHYQIKSKEF